MFNLEGFTDADWATNLDDRKSLSGLCILLGGNLITWSSKKQTAVARSSTESKYRALASTAAELVWVQNLLIEIGVSLQSTPPILWCDNIGAQALSSNPVQHARTKHIELDIHFVRNLVAKHKLSVRYISSLHQPANIFTKPLPLERFSFLFGKLSLSSPPINLRGPIEDVSRITQKDGTPQLYPIQTHVTAFVTTNSITRRE